MRIRFPKLVLVAPFLFVQAPLHASSLLDLQVRFYALEESAEVMQAYRQNGPWQGENQPFSPSRARWVLERANAVWRACGVNLVFNEFTPLPGQLLPSIQVRENRISFVEQRLRTLLPFALSQSESAGPILKALAGIRAAGETLSEVLFRTDLERLDDSILRVIVVPEGSLLHRSLAPSHTTADLDLETLSRYFEALGAGEEPNFDRDTRVSRTHFVVYGYHADPFFEDAVRRGIAPPGGSSPDASVLAHEIGHFLGLNHTYASGVPNLMGWPTVNVLEPEQCQTARDFLAQKHRTQPAL